MPIVLAASEHSVEGHPYAGRHCIPCLEVVVEADTSVRIRHSWNYHRSHHPDRTHLRDGTVVHRSTPFHV